MRLKFMTFGTRTVLEKQSASVRVPFLSSVRFLSSFSVQAVEQLSPRIDAEQPRGQVFQLVEIRKVVQHFSRSSWCLVTGTSGIGTPTSAKGAEVGNVATRDQL